MGLKSMKSRRVFLAGGLCLMALAACGNGIGGDGSGKSTPRPMQR